MLRTAIGRSSQLTAAPLLSGASTPARQRCLSTSTASAMTRPSPAMWRHCSPRPPWSYRAASTASAAHPRQDSRASGASALTMLLLAGAVAGGTLFATRTPLLAEAEQPKAAKYTKKDVSVVCVIGGPAAGKSTQVQNIVKRFGLTHIKTSEDIPKQIEAAIASAPKGKKPRVILEGFPTTIEQSDGFERDVGPILVVLFIDLEAEKALARLEQRDKSIQNDARINWKRFEDKSRAIVKRFRDEGNILEITGEWPADEVWEQVEAKFESALELDDRGEL